jgi:hypothetical protein
MPYRKDWPPCTLVSITEYIMEFYQENHRATWLAMGEIYPQKAAFI